jgi:hypothetical protein
VFLKDWHNRAFKVGKRVVESEDDGPRGEVAVRTLASKIASGNGLVPGGGQ